MITPFPAVNLKQVLVKLYTWCSKNCLPLVSAGGGRSCSWLHTSAGDAWLLE